jgi:hypothetical protein
MNKWQGFAILFSLLSIGAVKETTRILNQSGPDIEKEKTILVPMSILFTAFFIFLAIKFWRKSSNQ